MDRLPPTFTEAIRHVKINSIFAFVSHPVGYNELHPREEDIIAERENIKAEITAFNKTGKILCERPEEMSYNAYRVLLILQKKKMRLKKYGK